MRWKLAAVLGWACVALMAFAGAQPKGDVPDEIRARKLVIEDEDGRPTITLGPAMLDGSPQIRLQAPHGRMSASITVNRHPEGAHVSLYDSETRSQAQMMVGEKGPIISAYNGKTRKAESFWLLDGPLPQLPKDFPGGQPDAHPKSSSGSAP